MVHTLTLIEDHKGYSDPKAIADEYVVTANLNITDLGVVGAPSSLTGDFLATTNTLTILAGSDAGRITKGMNITISGSTGNNSAFTVLEVTGDSANPTFTLSGTVATSEADSGLTLTPATREVVLASELGLSTINSVEIIGQESATIRFTPHLDATTGLYTTGTSNPFYFELEAITASSGADVALGTDVGFVRVRVHGGK